MQDFFTRELLERKQKNSQFSMRAMAKMIGISSGQLSKLIHGKKSLTSSVALKVIENLKLSKERAEILLRMIHPDLILKEKLSPGREPEVLNEHQIRELADWYHLGILSLCRLKTNQATPQWIASQLGIEEAAAQRALKLLIKLRLVWIENGKLLRSDQPITTSEDVPSEALRLAHKKNLELAIKKIDSVPVDDREYTYITTAIDPKKIKRAKRMILEFRETLSNELKSSHPTEVYTLAIQLFPLTKNKGQLS